MRKYLFCCLLCLPGWLGPSLAQTPRPNTDSLHRVLARLARQSASVTTDTLRVKTLAGLAAHHYQYGSPDSARTLMQEMMTVSQRRGWQKGIAISYHTLLQSCYFTGDRSRQLDYAQKMLAVSRHIRHDSLIGLAYSGLGGYYVGTGNYRLSIRYYQRAFDVLLRLGQYHRALNALNNVAFAQNQLGRYALALASNRQGLRLARQYRQPLSEAFHLGGVGTNLLATGQLTEGFPYMKASSALFIKLNYPVYAAQSDAELGTYLLKHRRYAEALPYFRQLERAYRAHNWLAEITDTNPDLLLYQTYKGLHQPANALPHLERYHALVDSSLHQQVKTGKDIVQVQLTGDQQKLEISRLKINELQQKQTLQNRTQTFLLIGLLLSLASGGSLLWYNRQIQRKNQVLRQKNQELEAARLHGQTQEMAALRAQMNPHFIFNCINSIKLYTLQNDTDRAADYLSKFARLIRLVLENSRADRVTLRHELEALQLYIELEAMRFKEKVQFSICVDPDIDQAFVRIPPLLLQPYVENAIWHGLMHKPDGGTVTIDVTQPTDQTLHIEITDDGIGRTRAGELKSKSAGKHKSFGMQVTADRIRIINDLYHTHTSARILDLVAPDGDPLGTQVVLDIPV
jgi:tetratricopeptide (TPR) repeat protein